MKGLKGLYILKAEGSLGRLLSRAVKHIPCAPSRCKHGQEPRNLNEEASTGLFPGTEDRKGGCETKHGLFPGTEDRKGGCETKHSGLLLFLFPVSHAYIWCSVNAGSIICKFPGLLKPSFSICAQDILKVEGNLNTIVCAFLVFGLFKSRKISFPLLPKPCFCLWHFLSWLRVPWVLGTEPGTCMLSLVLGLTRLSGYIGTRDL